MYESVKKMVGMPLKAYDGDIGTVDQFFYDDKSWAVRYLVANIGSLLVYKKVLLSPTALDSITDDELAVNATMEQIRNSPDIDAEKPISRQKEEELHDYYTWSYYWGYPLYYNSFGTELYPNIQYTDAFLKKTPETTEKPENHLRTTHEVLGYSNATKNGEFGYVDDLLIDMEQWVIRYLILNTGDFLPGRKILAAAHWVKDINWDNRTVCFDFPIDILKNGPTYDPAIALTRDFERRIYEYYEKTPYWIE